ncbi:ribonuclease H-like domain-containing protein [Tanacetum coccineum]
MPHQAAPSWNVTQLAHMAQQALVSPQPIIQSAYQQGILGPAPAMVPTQEIILPHALNHDTSRSIMEYGHMCILSPYFAYSEFKMKDLGALNYFLGISVSRDSTWMFLCQHKYALEQLLRAHMSNYNPSRSPVDTELKLGHDGDPVTNPTLYCCLAGGLYTLGFGLQLYASSTTSLIAYSGAYWAGCPATRRSISRYCVLLGNNLLSWSSKRQHTLSRSSVEFEYRCVANAVVEIAWLRNLLRELHTPLLIATLVYCDNVSAIYMFSNLVQHQQTKHIEISIHFVRNMVTKGQVRVLHVPLHYRYANIFTKG